MLLLVRNLICVFILFAFYVEVSSLTVNETFYWKGKELKLVHLLFRHGARTPIHTYAKDPYKNETYYPYGWGQLTNTGKDYLYKTGKWLKKRYKNYLGSFYRPDYIWAQSTMSNRTMMSLQTVLAGLFPPKGTPMEWNAELNWQPIPTFASPIDNDPLLTACPCPRYAELFTELYKSPPFKLIFRKNIKLLSELTHFTGDCILSPKEVESIYGILRAESSYGLQLPKWTEKYFPDRLIPLTEISMSALAGTDEMKLLKGGPFVKNLMEDWKQKIRGTILPKNRKMFIYCVHDHNFVPILSAINVWKPGIPGYGIMAMFELLKDSQTGEYGVVINLKKNEKSDPFVVKIPGCDEFCPLDKFIELTKNIIPHNWAKACQPKYNNTVDIFC